MDMNAKIIKKSQELLEKLASLSESELADLVLHHNRKYFEENNPDITDETFDKLVEALRFLNPKAKALFKIGHQDVTSASKNFGEDVVHQYPMLSLEKCYEETVFFKWAQKITEDLVAMPKIDGVACSLIYSGEGNLLQAATRGDGKIGENITKNVLLIADLPSVIPQKIIEPILKAENFLEIRGEIFLPISQFNKKFADAFASPRNLAAGFLKLKEADRTKNNFLKFFPYDLRNASVNSEAEKFLLLSKLGFSMMPWKIVPNDQNAISSYYDFLNQRSQFDYEVDGVVYRANAQRDQLRMGETAHHPRYAIAFKFQSETAQTKLIGIKWSVARSGIITPIALVEPVFLSGASISKASLHNLRIFLELGLKEQSLVEINRRGGVIPYLERVLSKKGDDIPICDSCPSCGGPVTIDGDFLRCKNPRGCEEVSVSKLVHFCHVLNLDGMGEKIIRKLVRAGFLDRFGDIFRLSMEKLLSLERMGEVLALKLLKEVEKKRTIDLATFIQALGINEIGPNVAQLLANNFHNFPRLEALTLEDLLPIHGIGDSIATSLIDGLREHADEINDLLSQITISDEETLSADIDQTHPLFGKTVLFTGKMAYLERKSAQDMVKSIGGKAPGAMSKNIDYLVIGDEGSPLLGQGQKSTKHKEAEKLIDSGAFIKIISESEFLKLLKK